MSASLFACLEGGSTLIISESSDARLLVIPVPPSRVADTPTYFIVYGDDFRLQIYQAQNGPTGVPRLNVNGLTYIDPIVSGVLA